MWSTAVLWAVTGGMCGCGRRMGSPSVLVVIKQPINKFNQQLCKIVNVISILSQYTASHMSFTSIAVLDLSS